MKDKQPLISIFLLALLMSGCAQLLFVTANTSNLAFNGEIVEDVAYGNLTQQKLDIFIPEVSEQDATRFPVVVFIHGGRWTFGNKNQYRFVGAKLASLGYVAVLPNTRLYPDVLFPAFVEDAALAVDWIINNIHQYNGNTDLFLTGHSSGAHIGALLVADERYLNALGQSPNAISAFAGMAGPYDFVPKEDDLKIIFGPPENYNQMVVSNFIGGDEPPMLLMYSLNDETVHVRNLELLKTKIQSQQGVVETRLYDEGRHAGIVAAFSWANPSGLPVVKDLNTFFQQHIKEDD